MQVITLHVSDTLFAAVQATAQASGQPLDEWLVAHLPHLLSLPPVQTDAAPGLVYSADEYPEDWTAEQRAEWAARNAAIEDDLAEVEARAAARKRNPPSREEAAEHVQRILKEWSPTYLSEEDALDLAMSKDLSEWNLNL